MHDMHRGPDRWLLGLGLALLAAFAGLAAYQKVLLTHPRYLSSEQLLAELAEVSLLEDEPQPGDWPQWRGPRRDGITTFADLLREWPRRGPPRQWRKSAGEGYSSFAVADARACSMVADDDREAILCWDLATGKELWRTDLAAGPSFQYPGPRATPTLVGNRLFTVTPAGLLLCLDATRGKIVWEVDLVRELDARPPRWGFAFSPLIEGELVLAIPGGSNGRCLAAFHRDTGKLVWAAEDDPPGYSSPVAATLAGVRQVIFFTGRRVLGVRPDDGELLWEYPWRTEFDVNAATPVVMRARGKGKEEWGYVFVSSGYERGCGLLKVSWIGNRFHAQAVYESPELCCHFSSPVRRGDYLYGLDEKRDLTCLDLRTGTVQWRFSRDEEVDDQDLRQRGFKKGSLIRVDDLLVVLGEDGKLALVEASPERYREIAAFRPFRTRCWTLPALAQGRLLLRDQREVLCLDVKKQ